MTGAEIKARAMVANRTTNQLIADFELTEKMTMTAETPVVRGWIMDELEKRNPDAFDAWVDSWEDSPRKFFLN